MGKTAALNSEDRIWRKTYTHLGIAVIIYICFRFFLLHPSETTGLTELGVKALSVFVPVCYLWCTSDVLWPSIAAIVILAIDGVMPATGAMAYVFGHEFVALTVSMFLLVDSMLSTGLLRRIARWIISRKVVHGRPYLFYFFFGIATWFIAICINYINAAIIMVALAREISASLGIERNHSFHTSMIRIVMATAIIGESTWPFGKAVDTIAFNQLIAYGVECTQFDFLIIGIPFSILALILAPLTLKLFIKPDVAAYDRYDDVAIRKELKESRLSKREKAVAILFIFAFIGIALPGFFKEVEIFQRLGVGGFCVLAVVIGGMIRVDKESLLDWKTGFNRAPWRSALFLGCCFLFVSFFTGTDYGIAAFFAHLMKPLTENLPATLIMVAALVIATIFTNFLSNAVVCVACFTAFMPALIEAGVSNAALVTTGIMIAFMCNSGISTPAGSSCTAYCTGPDSDITVKGALKYSVIMAIEFVLIGCLIMLPLGTLLFG